MESVLKADIFFVIASIGVIAVTLAVVAAVLAILRVVKDVQHLIHSVQHEIETFKIKRRGIEINGRTAFKVLKLLALRSFGRR